MINEYQLQVLRNNISHKIKNYYITQEEIDGLTKMNISDIIKLWESSYFKDQILYDIYVNPFLLCDDNMLKSSPIFSIDTISNILIKRYNEEILELKNQHNNGFISQDEFHNNCLYFHNLYFNSSLIGQRVEHLYQDDIIDLDIDDKKIAKK